ncbi:MAG: hypothetical protein ACRD4P_13425 [Bryobacteraceae bacterium]
MRFAQLLFAIPAAITAVLLINFCALIFHCGCHSLWSGAGISCNIHMAGMRHCPWCTDGHLGHKVALTLIVAAQLLLAFFPRSIGLGYRWLLALAAFPVIGAAAAVAFGWAQGYWLR